MLLDLWVHRAGVLARAVVRGDGRILPLAKEGFRVRVELLLAVWVAEVIGLPFVVNLADCLVGRYGHPTDRIDNVCRRRSGWASDWRDISFLQSVNAGRSITLQGAIPAVCAIRNNRLDEPV